MARALLLSLVLGFACSAHAYFQVDLMKGKRLQAQDGVQWTLADWLSQKNKKNLMDQWLAMHRSGRWLELSAQASELQYTSTGTQQRGQLYRGNIYVSLVDLYAETERTDENLNTWAAAGGLRLLGRSLQTTSLVVRYGAKQWMLGSERVSTPFVDGELQLYILSWFGIQGEYRYYFRGVSNLGNPWEGHRWSAGAFVELGVLRLFADYYQEPIEAARRAGLMGGVGLYF
jgi:hypothetical protein